MTDKPKVFEKDTKIKVVEYPENNGRCFEPVSVSLKRWFKNLFGR